MDETGPLLVVGGMLLLALAVTQYANTLSVAATSGDGSGSGDNNAGELPQSDPSAGSSSADATDYATGGATVGIRNNNPGNIIATNIAWQGKTGNDGHFEIFDTARNGIRALARNLLDYYNEGARTLATIGPKWSDNAAGYAAGLASFTGFAATATLNLLDVSTLLAVTDAIILQENGQNPYSADTVLAGVQDALATQATS